MWELWRNAAYDEQLLWMFDRDPEWDESEATKRPHKNWANFVQDNEEKSEEEEKKLVLKQILKELKEERRQKTGRRIETRT